MTELLTWLYPWMKTLHIISVMSWMAGLLYLPRLMVYHTENAIIGGEMDATFQVMEHRLYQYIMTPAMVATWFFGILLSLTPYIIDWQQIHHSYDYNCGICSSKILIQVDLPVIKF